MPGSGKDDAGRIAGDGGARTRTAVRLCRRPPPELARHGAARALRYIRRQLRTDPQRGRGGRGREGTTRDRAQPLPSHDLGSPRAHGGPRPRAHCALALRGRKRVGAEGPERGASASAGKPRETAGVPAGNARSRRDPAGRALRNPPFPLQKYLSPPR